MTGKVIFKLSLKPLWPQRPRLALRSPGEALVYFLSRLQNVGSRLEAKTLGYAKASLDEGCAALQGCGGGVYSKRPGHIGHLHHWDTEI